MNRPTSTRRKELAVLLAFLPAVIIMCIASDMWRRLADRLTLTMLAYALIAFGLTWFVMLATDLLRLSADERETFITAVYLTVAALIACAGWLLAHANPNGMGGILGVVLGSALEYALRRILRPKWLREVHRAGKRVNDRSALSDDGDDVSADLQTLARYGVKVDRPARDA